MNIIKKVLANVAQSLTDDEKRQARRNIGAKADESDIFDCFVYLYEATPSGTPFQEIYDAMAAGKLVRLKAIMSIVGDYVYCYPYGSEVSSMVTRFIGYDEDGYILEVALRTYQTVSWSYKMYPILEYYESTPSGASNIQIPAGQTASSTFTISLGKHLQPGAWQMTGVLSGNADLNDYNLALGTHGGGASQRDRTFFVRIGEDGSASAQPLGICGGAVVRSAYSYAPDVPNGHHTMSIVKQPVSCLFNVVQTTDSLPVQIHCDTLSSTESALISLQSIVFRQVINIQ